MNEAIILGAAIVAMVGYGLIAFTIMHLLVDGIRRDCRIENGHKIHTSGVTQESEMCICCGATDGFDVEGCL